MNARETIKGILERGGATLVIHVYGGVVTDVNLDGLEIPYTLLDHDEETGLEDIANDEASRHQEFSSGWGTGLCGLKGG